MGCRTRFSFEQKLEIVTFYLSLPLQQRRYAITTEKYQCSISSLKLWVKQYLDHGKKGLKPKKQAKYSTKFKQSIVKRILSREVTKASINKEHGICLALLNIWIDKFNYQQAKGLESNTRRVQYSIDDMLNAVKYIKEEANIAHVSRNLNISMPTLRKWYKLYTEDGIKALNRLYLNSLNMTKSKSKSKNQTPRKEVQASVVEEKTSTKINSNLDINLTGNETHEEVAQIVERLKKELSKAKKEANKAERKAQQRAVENAALKKLCTLLKII